MKLNFSTISAVLALAALLAVPGTAAAFRCGNKLVKEGMHEVEVVAICGDPTSRRSLGYALRLIDYEPVRPGAPGWTLSRRPGQYAYPAEVLITEFVYNLGPRKLMRRLVFEGGLLVRVETLGRGYRE